MSILDHLADALHTIDCNASLLESIDNDPLLLFEKEALIKTQESLKARVIFLIDMYPKERKHSSVPENLLNLARKCSSHFPKRLFNPLFAKKAHLRKRRMNKSKVLIRRVS